MSVCSCYRDMENWLHERGVCYGTKECEPCSCGGDESKCNFYPEKSKPQTNADRIRAMTDKELAEFLLNRDLDIVEKASKSVGFTYKVDREPCLVNVIDWLKQEVIE